MAIKPLTAKSLLNNIVLRIQLGKQVFKILVKKNNNNNQNEITYIHFKFEA